MTVVFVATMIFTAGAQTTLFNSEISGEENRYRIPAVVQTTNNDILVFSDKRYSGGDVGQMGSNKSRIDIVYRRYSNNTWGNEVLVKQGENKYGYGDVAVVSNRENPAEIVFFTAAGNVFYTNSTQDKPLRCWRFYSMDGGANWDWDIQSHAQTGNVGVEVTSQIYGLDTNYTGLFFSSGRICQSSKIKVGTHYRLYAALCARKNGDNSVVIFSDDFGKSWKILGTAPAISGGNEAKCEELPNGNVLVSSRAAGKRYFNVFSYSSTPTSAGEANGSWNSITEGVALDGTNATNGEILIVPAVKISDQSHCWIVLQSVPAGSSGSSERSNVSIYWKVLQDGNINSASTFSSGWTKYPVSTITSAYSTMIQLANGNIAFAYEEDHLSNVGSGVYDINTMSSASGPSLANM